MSFFLLFLLFSFLFFLFSSLSPPLFFFRSHHTNLIPSHKSPSCCSIVIYFFFFLAQFFLLSFIIFFLFLPPFSFCFAGIITPNLMEQASIWCFFSIAQIAIMLFCIRETLIINWGKDGVHQSLLKANQDEKMKKKAK
jgi:hypothetical protein